MHNETLSHNKAKANKNKLQTNSAIQIADSCSRKGYQLWDTGDLFHISFGIGVEVGTESRVGKESLELQLVSDLSEYLFGVGPGNVNSDCSGKGQD